MISSLLAFFSSNAGGALVGLIIEWLDKRRQEEQRRQEFELKRDLAYKNQLEKHFTNLDKEADGTSTPKKFTLQYGKFKYEREKHVHHYAPRAYVVSWSLFMLAFTFCAVLLLWAGNPDATIISLNPTEEPIRVGIPWLFMAEWHRNDVFVLNAGGVVYPMLLAVNFILSTAIVGGVRRALR